MTEECPNIAAHTKCPSGYHAWHAWAEKKIRRHEPTKCPCCRRYVIWKRRPKGEPDFVIDDSRQQVEYIEESPHRRVTE